MKVLILLATVALAQAAPQSIYRDLSKYKPKYPTVPNVKTPFNLNPTDVSNYVPRFRQGTKDMTAVCGNAKSAPSSDRIVGGWEATPNQYPWMAALFIDNRYFCGGSLIDEQHVLTAAHCTEGAGFIDVLLGAHNVRLANESGRLDIRATTHVEYPLWNSYTLQNDIAIITLPQPLNFTDQIAPICLPSVNETIEVGGSYTLSGWGKYSDNISRISPVLRKTNSTAITNGECARFYGKAFVTKNIVCTRSTSGQGTCSGDSGGPMKYVSPDGIFKQVAITSFGAASGCEQGYPSGFCRVAPYLDWISSETGIKIN